MWLGFPPATTGDDWFLGLSFRAEKVWFDNVGLCRLVQEMLQLFQVQGHSQAIAYANAFSCIVLLLLNVCGNVRALRAVPDNDFGQTRCQQLLRAATCSNVNTKAGRDDTPFDNLVIVYYTTGRILVIFIRGFT